jgi:hypothetical protein
MPKMRSIRKQALLLGLMCSASAVTATAGYAMIWTPGGVSGDIIDCRNPCVDACADYRTTWQSITCFFSS